MTYDSTKTTRELIAFIEESPTAFHAVRSITDMLDKAGFTALHEKDEWNIVPGGKYYVTRNRSSVIAFAVPEAFEKSFLITASHTDSPTYKVKAELDAFGKYTKLSVEGYGGMIASSWLDRPLSLAGRVLSKNDGKIETKLFRVDRDLLLIPSVAIHQNRSVNSGYSYNPAVDLCPLFGGKDKKGSLINIIAEAAGCGAETILDSDIFLYNRTPATVWGAENEFFSAPRIDNLQSAYSTLVGFIDAVNANECRMIPVYSSFDNEETGSSTKQGADSQFLFDTLTRLCEAFGMKLPQALASSFMVSADNGHAKHPNHPEYSDSMCVPHMNEGVVIKSNANQKYTSDAVSTAIFKDICAKADVPLQYFANRSDLAGGSTLGSISNTNVALNTVDIGLAQLAMHSSYETAGTLDTAYMIRAIREFYRTKITAEGDGVYILS